ncbi:Na+/H+ antiporter subunit E [Paracandidimonas lactea]|uniref:Na+/H+ antiporter subunit E n=1 Tax=Paracandidimonas lactea TaxID=2895524 RepID=UPI001F0161B1|nr:Na+/H+ antiporter subunit E [Paracandidimonas lactea]
MKRLLNALILPAFLLLLWLLLNDSASPGHIALGAFLGVLLAAALWASQLRPVRASPRRLGQAILLAGRVAWDITKSNIAVARLIWLGPRSQATPGFIKIPLRLRDPHGLAVLACIVTYTPGTVWSEYADTDGILTLHVLDLKDEQEWLDIIQLRYERPLLEIFK